MAPIKGKRGFRLFQRVQLPRPEFYDDAYEALDSLGMKAALAVLRVPDHDVAVCVAYLEAHRAANGKRIPREERKELTKSLAPKSKRALGVALATYQLIAQHPVLCLMSALMLLYWIEMGLITVVRLFQGISS